MLKTFFATQRVAQFLAMIKCIAVANLSICGRMEMVLFFDQIFSRLR